MRYYLNASIQEMKPNTIIVAILVIIVVGLTAYIIGTKNAAPIAVVSNANAAALTPTDSAATTPAPIDRRQAIRNNWQRHFKLTGIPKVQETDFGLSGGFNKKTATFVNSTDFDVSIASVAVTYTLANGATKTEHVQVGEVPANSSTTFEIPGYNRGMSRKIRIASVFSYDLAFNYDSELPAAGADPWKIKDGEYNVRKTD
jgi:hypothetical protein